LALHERSGLDAFHPSARGVFVTVDEQKQQDKWALPMGLCKEEVLFKRLKRFFF
jgi:hypothetical protein